jgi:hypothetical protein
MSPRPHKVHKASFYRGPRLADGWAVWCSAGDLDLTNLTAEQAEVWVAKHQAEHPEVAA